MQFAQRKGLAGSFEPDQISFSRNKPTIGNTAAEFLSEKGRQSEAV
jgi:hypothetical protein